MGVVFTKKLYEVNYVDTLQLPDGYGIRLFTAEITIKERQACKALQGGRIIRFHMYDDDGCTLCRFDDGKWEMPLDTGDYIAEFARDFFVTHWNNLWSKSKPIDKWCEDVRDFESDCFPTKKQLARKT